MKANELRIGNYIDCEYGTGQIVKIDSENIFTKENGEVVKESVRICINKMQDSRGLWNFKIKPIPLTEEILLKCGFECFEFDNGQPNQYRFKNRLIVIRNGNFVDYGSDVIINSLHQLQNLYFALTGEELTINL